MRRITIAVILTTLFYLSLANAQQAAAPSAAGGTPEAAGRLPVKRVVLYKNGVGYFEHSTHVRGTQDLNIDFTSGQLDDALKSLTVVDLGGGHIQGVRFNSVAPLSERLKTLRLPLDEKTSQRKFLDALRGTRVEVHSGGTSATGKLLSVDTVKRAVDKDQTIETPEVTLVTDNGEMYSFELTPGVTLRIADRELSDEVNRYLNLIGSAKAVDLRRLTISAAGSGDREIFVSYISEVPVWKSTYRVLLDANHANKPLVQGWAVVDNTIGEDWKDVQLSLVAGAPQSFVEKISQPLYVQRPEVAVPESAMLTPETHEAAMEEMKLAAAPPPPAPPPPPGPMPTTAQMSRIAQPGITHQGKAIVSGRGAGVGPGTGAGVGGGVLGGNYERWIEQERPEAESKTVGDFFQYDLKEKVTIGKNQSALVPILQSRVEAEKVTLWNEGSNTPRRALWLNNTSGTEFDAGSFNILDEDTLAGEGILDAVRPGEKRLVSYAADTAVRVKTNAKSSLKPFRRIVIVKGLMTMTREERRTRTYTLSNSDNSPRDVIIEHPVQSEWKLAEGLKPEESSASFYRFRVKVGPKEGANLVVEESRPNRTEMQLTDINSGWIELLTQQERMTPAMQQAFKRVLDQKDIIAGLDTQIQTRQQEVDSITEDQGRIRENMKALKGSPEEKALVQRYTQQLNQQEDRLAALRSQIADLQAKQQKEKDQLDKILTEISLDESF